MPHKRTTQRRRKRPAYRRKAFKKAIRRVFNPNRRITLSTKWVNKYAVQSHTYSLNGGAQTGAGVISSATGAYNSYGIVFRMLDIEASALSIGNSAFGRAKLLKVVLGIVPRVTTSVPVYTGVSNTYQLQLLTDLYYYINENPEGVPTSSASTLATFSSYRGKRANALRRKYMTIKNLRVSQTITDNTFVSNTYTSIPAPYLDLETGGTPSTTWQILEHQGAIVSFNQTAAIMYFDFDSRYYVEWSHKIGVF